MPFTDSERDELRKSSERYVLRLLCRKSILDGRLLKQTYSIHNLKKEKSIMTKFHFYTFDNLTYVGSALAYNWVEACKIVALEKNVDVNSILPQEWKRLSACEPK